MTLIAEPPDLAAAAGRHLLRCKAAVARRVPLRGNDRLYRREVVEAGQNLVVGAIRTIASTPHAVSYNSRIGMSLFRSATTRGGWSRKSLPPVSERRFFAASHCAASCGYWVARSFSPCMTFCPAQNGQPVPPPARDEMAAR